VAAAGERGALIATGAILPAVALLALRRLDRIDDVAEVPVHELEILRRVRLFDGLRAPQLERLARRVEPLHAIRGTAIVRQGEPGDRFYVVASGEVEVTMNGTAVATLGPGDYFGEIALLHDVPRTATVTAETDVELFALDRSDLVETVTGNVRSAETASRLIQARLGELRELERPAVHSEPHRDVRLDR
jgi:CRP-like cAMP-binding protein